MKRILIGLLTVGTLTSFAQTSGNEMTLNEWKQKCVEPNLENYGKDRHTSNRGLGNMIRCTSGVEGTISPGFDPFQKPTRPFSEDLNNASSRCSKMKPHIEKAQWISAEAFEYHMGIYSVFMCMYKVF